MFVNCMVNFMLAVSVQKVTKLVYLGKFVSVLTPVQKNLLTLLDDKGILYFHGKF